MGEIKKFVIYGERCSGTNFLENAIKTNFGLELRSDFGSKHFFCFNKYHQNLDDTLFIGIVRNPIYWINSLSKELYHIPNKNKPLDKFLFNEFYSVEEKTNKLQIKDLNYANLNKYKNIFEMRKMKNSYLINVMPKKVKNYILINYESLLYNYNYTLDYISTRFNIKKIYEEYKQIKQYKKADNFNFNKQRTILLPEYIVEIIWRNLYLQQENYLGYYKYNNNEIFKSQNNIKFITSSI